VFKRLPDRLKPLATVALHTGMRKGELLALRWHDVDFYTGARRVREARSGDGRSVAMNSVVWDTLKRVRQEQIQRAREQAKGGRQILSPFVFCSHRGRFLHNLAKAWYPAVEAAGIEDFRFHDLSARLRVSISNGRGGPLYNPAGRGMEDGDHGAAVRAPVAGPYASGTRAFSCPRNRHPDRHWRFSGKSSGWPKC